MVEITPGCCSAPLSRPCSMAPLILPFAVVAGGFSWQHVKNTAISLSEGFGTCSQIVGSNKSKISSG